MRTLTLTLATVAFALTVTACGGDDPAEPAAGSTASPDVTTSTPARPDAPLEEVPEAFAAVESTLADAEKLAVELEQIFFREGYPADLAGAITAAEAAGLEQSPGNTLAGYTFDAEQSEFRLCVENTDGAFATYDTRPMSMRDSGSSGGCP